MTMVPMTYFQLDPAEETFHTWLQTRLSSMFSPIFADFNFEQHYALSCEFDLNPSPNGWRKRDLAHSLGVSLLQVSDWFEIMNLMQLDYRMPSCIDQREEMLHLVLNVNPSPSFVSSVGRAFGTSVAEITFIRILRGDHAYSSVKEPSTFIQPMESQRNVRSKESTIESAYYFEPPVAGKFVSIQTDDNELLPQILVQSQPVCLSQPPVAEPKFNNSISQLSPASQHVKVGKAALIASLNKKISENQSLLQKEY